MTSGGNRRLILVAMIFAVSMTFIDQTIVALAIPELDAFGEATGRAAQRAFEAVQHDFALSTRTVFHVMSGVLVPAFIVAHLAMPAGRVEAEVMPALADATTR